jgi:hypothetical protein
MKFAIALLLIGCAAQINAAGVYTQRFLDQHKKIHDSSNGYFSPEGIPYHSIETLMVEAPDHGHQTTSEAYSYYIWLEAMNGGITKDYSSFNKAWEVMEKYCIPGHSDQPTNSFYKPDKPATFAAEQDTPNGYPSPIETGVPVGHDPIAQELSSAYGSSDVYGMHWLQDVDNIYGFGNAPGVCEGGPGTKGPSNINTYQRGPQESVWRTIPQPTCDTFKYGGRNGFLDLFVKDSNYAKQWKFTAAPDADARAIQGAFWAATWAKAQGKEGEISQTLAKAGKLGDYMRYALFDKYFKKIGNCVNRNSCPGASGKESAHYLLSWYYAWGGALDTSAGWSWRIGDGSAHFGYQNPLAAYALSNVDSMKPKGSSAVEDWKKSLERQIEFYEYLQTAEGAFAGGATNTWNGRYDTPPSNLSSNTFYGMFYDWEPVYHDPPSNNWYGMQAWSTDRLAQYYYVTGDAKAKALLDKWVAWVLKNTKTSSDGTYQIPSTLNWEGVPNTFSGGSVSPNANLHVRIVDSTSDVGTAAATARTLSYYAAKANNAEAKKVAKEILDGMWKHYQTPHGVAGKEERPDYKRFNEKLYVPSGWEGKMPNGDVISSNSTFISIRSFYKKDKDWPKVEAYLKGGAVPTFTYHRFWQQADVALAQGAYGILFNE